MIRQAFAKSDALSVSSLCEQFLHSKRVLLERGDFSRRSIEQYEDAAERLIGFFGPGQLVNDIMPIDFSDLHSTLPLNWGPHSRGRVIRSCRAIFNYAYDSGLIQRKLAFGSDFRNPSARSFRRARNAQGSRMFEAEEIRQLIAAAGVSMRAMILLGINCGFGNADCGRLPISAIDLESGWVNYPRPKTEMPRRAALWPETVEAIKRSLASRSQPATQAFSELVFLTCNGEQWCDGMGGDALSMQFSRLTRSLKLRRGRGFYALRRAFETIGGNSLDQVAVDYIMGHVPRASDMAAVYRQGVADYRLIAVTDCVRAWLFPDDAANYFRQHQAKASEIFQAWELKEKIVSTEVAEMLKILGVKPSEFARCIGLNAQWVSALICGRERISRATETRFRAFVEQLALGKAPGPMADRFTVQEFDAASDVSLSADVRNALMNAPLTATELKLLAEHLATVGVSQVQLAAWWGCGYRRYHKLKGGRHRISHQLANRLRALFELPQIQIRRRNPRRVVTPGKIPANEQLRQLLQSEPFGASEFRAVTDWMKAELNVPHTTIMNWLGLSVVAYSHRRSGKAKRSSFCRQKLRGLFLL